jgi:hypothetical protein
MNDDPLEQLMQRYRVADPPGRLRGAVLSERVPLRPVDWMMTAAAAVLVAAVAFTGGPASDAHASAAFDQQVEAIAASLGGGPRAVAIALMAVSPAAAPGTEAADDQ